MYENLMVMSWQYLWSPIAHGIMEAKVKSKGWIGKQIQSNIGWHDGEQPDRRQFLTAKK